MRKPSGVTITLLNKVQTGVDDLDNPIYVDEEIQVDDVLVAPVSTDDFNDTISLYGRKAVYQLAIPKGDANNWENQKVVLPEPFAGTYRTIGFPTAGIEDLIPLRWNKKVMVERYG